MLCEQCGKAEATVHVTRMVNGEVSTEHLCASCAREKGEFQFMADPGALIQNVMAALMGQTAAEGPREVGQGAVCPACGTPFTHFQATGRLGCPVCYEAFGELLAPLVNRIQAGDHHVGRVPLRLGPTVRRQKQLADLRSELRRLVDQEAYEEAAHVRDRIRALETEGADEGREGS